MADAAETIKRPLDEVMLAMDVVDTLRHRANLVERELNEDERDRKLIERLREIYRAQGIDVPDSVLREGVSALKEDRFVYKPPDDGLSVRLARLYVSRAHWGKYALGALGVVVACFIGYYMLVERPRVQRAELARRELAEILPRELASLREQVINEAQVDKARELAGSLHDAGIKALAAKDAVRAREATKALSELAARLRREYVMTIVSRPGESSGVWRIPKVNARARNYYLVVEALDSSGRALALPIKNEEDGKTYSVKKWGMRVSGQVFDQVRRDKSDDGIIQNGRMAVKRRGFLDPEYLMSAQGGAITRW